MSSFFTGYQKIGNKSIENYYDDWIAKVETDFGIELIVHDLWEFLDDLNSYSIKTENYNVLKEKITYSTISGLFYAVELIETADQNSIEIFCFLDHF